MSIKCSKIIKKNTPRAQTTPDVSFGPFFLFVGRVGLLGCCGPSWAFVGLVQANERCGNIPNIPGTPEVVVVVFGSMVVVVVVVLL